MHDLHNLPCMVDLIVAYLEVSQMIVAYLEVSQNRVTPKSSI